MRRARPWYARDEQMHMCKIVLHALKIDKGLSLYHNNGALGRTETERWPVQTDGNGPQ